MLLILDAENGVAATASPKSLISLNLIEFVWEKAI